VARPSARVVLVSRSTQWSSDKPEVDRVRVNDLKCDATSDDFGSKVDIPS
jgi:hypothetical protein